jgi:glycerol-3-phosphate acyltransferase PlsX
VGHEEIKGNELTRNAYPLLKACPIAFIGNVEGDDVFRGDVDVVVCDGFVGNVALKTSEGLAKMISSILKEEFSRSWLTKLAGLIALPVLRALRRRLDGRQYNGANLLGLRGIVIKSHGSADRYAFGCALDVAHRTAQSGLLNRITEDMARVNAHLGIETSARLEDNPAP